MKKKVRLQESRIDEAIKQYLKERKEGLDPEYAPEQNVFSQKARETFDEMSIALTEIAEDLMVIQTKESDVIVEDYPEPKTADEFITELVNQIELVIEAIEHLRDFEPEE
jgi:hypothetical protein